MWHFSHVATTLIKKPVKSTPCFSFSFTWIKLAGHIWTLSLQTSKERERGVDSGCQESVGQTLTSARNVAARWFIFKQVRKLQILIGAVDSAELFLQIFLVVKRGHRSKMCFPATPPSSDEAAETRLVCWCGLRGNLFNCQMMHRRAARAEALKFPASSARWRRVFFCVCVCVLFFSWRMQQNFLTIYTCKSK